MKTYDSLVFTHIPKCGGTSFRRFICDVAVDNDISPRYIHAPGLMGVSNDKNLSQLSPMELAELKARGIKILADHTCFGDVQSYSLGLKNPFCYTILREPVSRFISHYNFFCKRRGDHNMLGVDLNNVTDAKLSRLLLIFSNVQVRYISNIQRSKLNKDSLKKALENLHKGFACFGILEDVKKSIELLKQRSPSWLRITRDFPKVNRNSNHGGSEVASEIIKKITEANRLEIALYDAALNLLHQSV